MNALPTFRRAMRRHEKRARGLRMGFLGDSMRDARVSPNEDTLGAIDFWHRAASDNHAHRHLAPARWLRDAYRRRCFVLSRAADAVARLRAAGGAS